MKDILSHETLIEGDWLVDDKQVYANESCLRIKWLIERKLKIIGVSQDGWEALYEDPSDKRYWILYYPKSEYHNGGPPSLRIATEFEVKNNFIINR